MLVTQAQFKERALNKIKSLQKQIHDDFDLCRMKMEKELEWDDLYRLHDIYSTAIGSLAEVINKMKRSN